MLKDKTQSRLNAVRFGILGFLLVLTAVILNSCMATMNQHFADTRIKHDFNLSGDSVTYKGYPKEGLSGSAILIVDGLDKLKWKPASGKKYTIMIAEEK